MNLTAKLLLPILNTFGRPFVNKINNCKIKGYYIDDLNLRKVIKEGEYILIELLPSKNLEKDLAWFRTQIKYVTDYPYDYEGSSHVIVFDISNYKEAVKKFIEGKYSEMFTLDEIRQFGLDPSKPLNRERFGIWSKDENYKRVFVERLNEEFGTEFKSEELELSEYELPVNFKHEIL